MSDAKFPDDVNAESGYRLPPPERENMGADAQVIFDSLMDPASDSLVGLWGPGGIRLHSPELAVRLRPVNQYLRHEAGYGPKMRELAILVTAREFDSRFEWAAHEPEALRQGLSQELIDIVKHRGDVAGLEDIEAAVIRLGRELFRDHRVSPATFADALGHFGERDLVDLVGLMGQYAATAVLLATFDIQLHPGTEAILPVD